MEPRPSAAFLGKPADCGCLFNLFAKALGRDGVDQRGQVWRRVLAPGHGVKMKRSSRILRLGELEASVLLTRERKEMKA